VPDEKPLEPVKSGEGSKLLDVNELEPQPAFNPPKPPKPPKTAADVIDPDDEEGLWRRVEKQLEKLKGKE
jgi:hypothetical protein